MNNYFVYIILCENDSFYTGITNDLIKRFDKHKKRKGANYTKMHKPLKYISVWEVENINSALKIEYYIKTKSKNIKTLFIENNKETSEEEIFNKIQESAVVTYKMYAVTLEKGSTTYVSSKSEAEQIINSIKEKQEDAEISMQEIYTQNLEELESKVEVASNVQTKLEEEYEKIESSTFNGIYFSVKPVTGNITSRFGAVESIRDHAHMGMDIAAPNGTPIKAAADGTVKFAGTMGGYGNLVIISHGNGVETYYGHCSKIYVTKGQEVTAGDEIAAVGSTGYSTGNHLHFEIRKDGAQVNPQKYLYK